MDPRSELRSSLSPRSLPPPKPWPWRRTVLPTAAIAPADRWPAIPRSVPGAPGRGFAAKVHRSTPWCAQSQRFALQIQLNSSVHVALHLDADPPSAIAMSKAYIAFAGANCRRWVSLGKRRLHLARHLLKEPSQFIAILPRGASIDDVKGQK